MAKYESEIKTRIGALADYLHGEILNGSISASYEDGTDYTVGSMRVIFNVYERYSYLGGTRVSLAVTLTDAGDGVVHLCAITAGGSQAMFFKINTLGEEAFLDKLSEAVDAYKASHRCESV